MWSKNPIRAIVGAAAVLVLVVACGRAPDRADDSGGGFSACMITDVGGIDDRSFNAAVWQGLRDAADRDDTIDPSYRSSESDKDYQPNLKQSINKGCEVVIAVGGLMSSVTEQVAQDNPDAHFIIVDAAIDLPNVYSVQFDTAQPAFLAGYLAAGMSATGTVATFGGSKIAPVTIFMDGFTAGVDHYNDVKDADVTALGWNRDKQEGIFVGSFTDQTGARRTTQDLLSRDADVILPVAGNAALGAPSAAQGAGDVSIIWVDFDGCTSVEQYCALFLTSVIKEIPAVIADAVLAAADGDHRSGSYLGTLDNDGVGIAPYHDFADRIPDALQSEVEQLRSDIADGTVTVESPSSP